MKKKIAYMIIIICVMTAVSTTIIIDWLYNAFENLSMNEIVFQLKVPLKGTSTQLIDDFLEKCPLKILGITAILLFILLYPIKKQKKQLIKSTMISILILVIGTGRIMMVTDISEYIKAQMNYSTLIKDEYVAPEKVALEFPEQKRNLIYIFLESMETTFCAKEDGGLSENDLIPEISKLAKENLNFSNTSKIGGAYTTYGTTWTIAAMTAQTTGVPLKISIEENSLSEYSSFLGGAHSIGEILEDNGYHNFLLLGSDATFGGRRNLFTQHGNYEIWDYVSAREEGKVKEHIWWGYTDEKLFEYAKEKILNLSNQEKPFNFTMLTVDTHFQDGYTCEDCPTKWDKAYENVISCSSQKVGEFVEWIKQQDFYENTTIVISGDHLTMQAGFFELEPGQNYDKKVISLIINPAIEAENTTRAYSTFDLYPTTLAALGVKIEGDKLALGTNLFSKEQTLIEKYGLKYVNEELKKTSIFYNNNILVKNY